MFGRKEIGRCTSFRKGNNIYHVDNINQKDGRAFVSIIHVNRHGDYLGCEQKAMPIYALRKIMEA